MEKNRKNADRPLFHLLVLSHLPPLLTSSSSCLLYSTWKGAALPYRGEPEWEWWGWLQNGRKGDSCHCVHRHHHIAQSIIFNMYHRCLKHQIQLEDVILLRGEKKWFSTLVPLTAVMKEVSMSTRQLDGRLARRCSRPPSPCCDIIGGECWSNWYFWNVFHLHSSFPCHGNGNTCMI